MLNMQIEAIEIRNYRVLRQVVIKDLSRLTALVGPNSSGKSTLFDVFSFLKGALIHNVANAVNKRGGFRELVSRGETGPISIALKLRETGGLRVLYELTISTNGWVPLVESETLDIFPNTGDEVRRLLDFSRGMGGAVVNENEYIAGAAEQCQVYTLDNPYILAINALGQFKNFRVFSELHSLIENWHISDFHIAEARPSAEEGYSEHLSTRGDNVAQVAQFLYEYHRDRFDQILEAMKRWVPGVEKIEAKPTEDGRLVLRFQDGAFKDPFIARYVSDGTIKMFAYLVLLHDPKPFPLLAVEEPENQLYPELLPALAEEFRAYAKRGGQVFISTHSPDFLNGLKLDEIYWLAKRNGFTEVHRASDSELLRNLYEEGDLPGALWKQGLFGTRI